MSLERLHSLLVDASNELDDLDYGGDPAMAAIDAHIDAALRLVQALMAPKDSQ